MGQMSDLNSHSDRSNSQAKSAPSSGGLLAIVLATGMGVGLKMPAPGTFGALWGIPLWLGLQQLPTLGYQILALGLIFLAGIPLCTAAARELVCRGWSKTFKDPQSIVIDEYATVPMVYAFVPAATFGDFSDTLPWWILGFALHRVFDISKPWPCRNLEKLPDGLGVMADDLVAALYAGLCYWGFYWVAGAIF